MRSNALPRMNPVANIPKKYVVISRKTGCLSLGNGVELNHDTAFIGSWPMPYILRDDSGKIIRASARSLHGGELVPHSNPEVIEFLKSRGQDPHVVEEALGELRKTDGEMARAVEDVIMVLLKKNVLKMTDLPKAVQDRMALRVKLRFTIQDIYDQASGSRA